jgi:hypothetical protein
MTNKARSLALIAVCALGLGNAPGADPAPPASLRLEITLSDGSRLIGVTSLATIPLVSDAMGTMDVSLRYIDAISFSEDHKSANVTFRNGDKIRGIAAGVTQLTLNTLVGAISVPMAVVREIRVHPAGNGKPLEWAVLPFPKNCDWPGAHGNPARVEVDEIVLQGQPVCTEQIYSAPMSFECVATLDELVANDGCLWIDFIPDGTDAELNVPPQNTAIQLGYHQRDEGGGMFTIAAAGAPPEDLAKGPFTFEAGKSCHLEIEVKPDGIRATLNGQVFETSVTLPFKSFHIELMGWQPTNTWHIRDFVVH